ncbi:MAG: Bax inhibitor-1/YccA family protein [Hydrogenophilus sp.]|nr:Bax inhibitor-1/YccA family protein [Hydrogenophilus sp.]
MWKSENELKSRTLSWEELSAWQQGEKGQGGGGGDVWVAERAQTQRVLRNTYALLAMTLAFSALTAGTAMALELPHPGLLITLIGYFGLLFLVHKLANRAAGILAVFALTGFMGYTLGPILAAYLKLANGPMIVFQALAGTAVTFVALAAYASTTKRDFSFLSGFLFVGMVVAFLAGLAAIFFELPALSLTVSAAVVLLMAGMILFEVNQIVRGGETNYVLATVALYVSIYNLFTSLLHLIGAMGSDE